MHTTAARSACGCYYVFVKKTLLAGFLASIPLIAFAVSSQASCPVLARTLVRGSRGADVASLQSYLISQSLLSSDSATGYFGPLTERAVQQWQKSRGIVSSGTPGTTGFGSAGPKTRLALQTTCLLQAKISPVTSTSTVSAASTTPPVAGGGGGGTVLSASCSFNNQTIAHGQSVTAYLTPSVSYGSSCVSETRVCANGNLGGSFMFTSCSVSSAAPIIDVTRFLTEDVCTDASNNPIPGDPATCSTHRDVRFGELIPYMRTDNRGSAGMSVPVQHIDGSLLFAFMKDFTANQYLRPLAAYNNWDIASSPPDPTYAPNGLKTWDGLDLVEADGANVSISGTLDAVHGFHPWFNTSCGTDDAWTLFPSSVALGQNGTIASVLRWDYTFALTNPLGCPTAHFNLTSAWEFASQPFTYTGGKSLPSLVSWVETDNGGNDKSYEVYYFTDEYGFTRWESWNSSPDGGVIACSGGSSQKVLNGVTLYRHDCRDWTYVQTDMRAIQPLSSPLGGPLVFSKNLLSFGDFSEKNFSSWTVISAPGKQTDYNFGIESSGVFAGNPYLLLGCYSGCEQGKNGVYQEISTADLSGAVTMRFGGIFSASQAAQGMLVLQFLDASGDTLITDAAQIITIAGPSWQRADYTKTWDFTAHPVSKIRFGYYPITGGVEHRIDDLYMTPTR